MTRKKTTLYLDAELLRAAKIAAAREDKPEYQVVEEALRRHLGADLLERVWSRSELSEADATRLSVDEVRAFRKERSKSSGARARPRARRTS
jgi:hypothetical protein